MVPGLSASDIRRAAVFPPKKQQVTSGHQKCQQLFFVFFCLLIFAFAYTWFQSTESAGRRRADARPAKSIEILHRKG
jgi:uncharacterized membrane protein YidH (DUF202 family)